MKPIVYDGSFSGWLTVIFQVYEYKWTDVNILPASRHQYCLFGDIHSVETDEAKADRVWLALKKKITDEYALQLFQTFLSEEEHVENVLLQYVRYAFNSGQKITDDYSNSAVLYVAKTARKVHREKHRMEAFVRFQCLQDGLYYAIIEPDYNVLPLIKKHFEQRYADQRWMIYDAKRHYGLYYDMNKVDIVSINFENVISKNGKPSSEILSEGEVQYQQLWKDYFKSVNIAARKNLKLHVQHMPTRYWKYLIEKLPEQ